jgi:hypothetical protein
VLTDGQKSCAFKCLPTIDVLICTFGAPTDSLCPLRLSLVVSTASPLSSSSRRDVCCWDGAGGRLRPHDHGLLAGGALVSDRCVRGAQSPGAVRTASLSRARSLRSPRRVCVQSRQELWTHLYRRAGRRFGGADHAEESTGERATRSALASVSRRPSPCHLSEHRLAPLNGPLAALDARRTS